MERAVAHRPDRRASSERGVNRWAKTGATVRADFSGRCAAVHAGEFHRRFSPAARDRSWRAGELDPAFMGVPARREVCDRDYRRIVV